MMEVQIEQLKADLESKPTVTEIQIDTTEIDELTAQNNSLTAELAMINDRVDELTDSLEFRLVMHHDRFKSHHTDLRGEGTLEKKFGSSFWGFWVILNR